jgi:hypothetical protein
MAMRENSEKWIPVFGMDQLSNPAGVTEILGPNRRRRELMEPDYLQRLRRHLSEAEWVADRRRPLRLSDDAQEVERNRNRAEIRRVKGPAGSGKTLGLAARAAALAKDEKEVLVLSYNITLPHYIHDLAARRCREIGASIRWIRFTHFHGFCADVVDRAKQSAFAHGARPLRTPDEARDEDANALINSAAAAYEDDSRRRLPRYDAILVDEGQDFELDWWNFLRESVRKPGGEMLLVADSTQDLYGRSGWTTEAQMRGAGFSGPWTQLRGSYRVPPGLAPLLSRFATDYLAGEIDVPAPPPDAEDQLFGPDLVDRCQRRWLETPPDRVAEVMAEEVRRLAEDVAGLHPDDVVFLVENHALGLDVVARLEKLGLGITHVFTFEDDEERRERKHRFWGGAGGTKGCTVLRRHEPHEERPRGTRFLSLRRLR